MGKHSSPYFTYIFPGKDHALDAGVLSTVFQKIKPGRMDVFDIGLYALQKMPSAAKYRPEDFSLMAEVSVATETHNPHIRLVWLYQEFRQLKEEVQTGIESAIRHMAFEINAAYIARGLDVQNFENVFIDVYGTRHFDHKTTVEYGGSADYVDVCEAKGGSVPVHPRIQHTETLGEWKKYEVN